MAKIADVQEVSLELLRPYERNAKKHGPEQVAKLKDSINEFGFISPCLIDRDYNVIAGHGRIMAAQEAGLRAIPCVFVEGLTEEQRKAYILADNRLSELAEWDMGLVSEELDALKELGYDYEVTGFTIDDIAEEDIDFSELDEKVEGIDQAIPDDGGISRGDIYALGDHLLICGDSTEQQTIVAIMGKEQADLLLTDPPYNVALGYHMRPSEAKQLHRRTDGLVIDNDAFDDADDFIQFLATTFTNAGSYLKPGGAFYIWYANNRSREFYEAVRQTGWEIRQSLVWVKNTFALGRQDYQWRHEPCLYGWQGGAAHYFIDDRTKSTVFEKKVDIDALTEREAKDLLRRFYREVDTPTSVFRYDKPSKSELHPTMKPVALTERQIQNSTKSGGLVLDIFGGSGTTLIACETTNRRCRMVEYDPHYCRVIIDRWEQLTGRKAVQING